MVESEVEGGGETRVGSGEEKRRVGGSGGVSSGAVVATVFEVLLDDDCFLGVFEADDCFFRVFVDEDC
jgi:hypothetical protein